MMQPSELSRNEIPLRIKKLWNWIRRKLKPKRGFDDFSSILNHHSKSGNLIIVSLLGFKYVLLVAKDFLEIEFEFFYLQTWSFNEFYMQSSRNLEIKFIRTQDACEVNKFYEASYNEPFKI